MSSLSTHYTILYSILCITLTGCSKKVLNPVLGIIEIDFRDIQNIPKYTHVLNGSNLVVRVENVNQNVFKVTSNITQTDYNTELPAVFSGIKLPGSLNLSFQPSPPAESPAFVPEKKGNRITEKNVDEEIEKIIAGRLNVINKTSQKIAATVDLSNGITNLVKSCNKSYRNTESELIDLVDTYLDTKSGDRKQQVDELKSQLITTIRNAIQAKIDLDSIAPIYLSRLSETPRKELIRELYDKATTAVVEIQKIKDENKIQALIDNYNLINPSNFNFTSEKVKINADEVTFKIEIISDKPLSCDVPTRTVISQTYKTKGGLKIDFSTGAFFNMGDADFLGRDIQYKPVNDTTTIIQSKDGGKRLLLSIGAFMHIYKRSGNKVNFALSPGISTTTGFDALNFHLGASVLFGGENRFVITAGATLKESKVLDKNYEFDKEYKKSLLPESPPTIAVFPKWGGFVSFTYNFSKFKKQG